MSDLGHLALAQTHYLPIKHQGDVHNGKVRSVFWLKNRDNVRLIQERNYPVHPKTQLGVMITSDRLSAFDVIWHATQGLKGVPRKGASLNAVSNYWFQEFDKIGLAGNHILEVPHPQVWIVQKADQVRVEAIARQYITGSMWRAYDKGERKFCGVTLPEGLQKNQRLDELLLTPTTKGTLTGIQGVPEQDDVNITREQIVNNWQAFGFKSLNDVPQYETLLKEGCALADKKLRAVGQTFVDTKFEVGYVRTDDGWKMVYIDEVLTPDSSRFWDSERLTKGEVIENSKEGYREFLLDNSRSGLETDVLLNKQRFAKRQQMAKDYAVPSEEFMRVSETYVGMAEKITGQTLPPSTNAREEMLDALSEYGLVA